MHVLESAIFDKSFDYAVEIVKLSKELMKTQGYALVSQLMRSGTSVGANVAEAQYAQSK